MYVVVISGLDVTSRQAHAEKPGITTSSPAHSSVADVYHQFVDDVFYEAGDSWTPVPNKPVARHMPTPREEGLY